MSFLAREGLKTYAHSAVIKLNTVLKPPFAWHSSLFSTHLLLIWAWSVTLWWSSWRNTAISHILPVGLNYRPILQKTCWSVRRMPRRMTIKHTGILIWCILGYGMSTWNVSSLWLIICPTTWWNVCILRISLRNRLVIKCILWIGIICKTSLLVNIWMPITHRHRLVTSSWWWPISITGRTVVSKITSRIFSLRIVLWTDLGVGCVRSSIILSYMGTISVLAWECIWLVISKSSLFWRHNWMS